MIPKVFHQIWIGGRPLPAEYRAFRETWRRHHPDWALRLWGDAEVAALGLRNADLLARVKTASERSDIVRYELLHRFGGVYVDADFECLRSISALVEPLTFFLGHDKVPHALNTGLMGVVAGHPFMDRVIEQLPRNLEACDRHGVDHPNHRVGTWFFSRMVMRERPTDLRVFATKTFYPYLWDELHRRHEDFAATTPQAYAVHHWAMSWAQPSEVNS